MAGFTTAQIRNVVFLGHSGSGKTSIADSMFHLAGETTRLGSVTGGTSDSDFEPEEQRRQSSVTTAILPSPWKNTKINVLDAPGYADFAGEMLSALRVADAAVLVISAPSGVEVGALQAWERLEESSLPRMVAINKLDRENTDFNQVVEEISEAFGRKCVPIQIPNGVEAAFTAVGSLISDSALQEGDGADLFERLVEAIAETDDELAEKYLEGESLTPEELISGLRSGVASGEIVPVLATAALEEVGVSELMDAIVDLLPSPADVDPVDIPDDAVANLVFKTSADPFVGKLSYFRVYGAPFTGNSEFYNVNKDESERVGQVSAPKGKETENTDEVVTGDIGVISRLDVTGTGDTLTDKAEPVTLDGIDMPEPFYALAVTPKTQADLDKMSDSLSRLGEEDPSLHISRDPVTAESIIRGLGDVHVEIGVERVERKFGVALETSLPRIAYMETIGGSARVEYRHKKQSGGHGQYGHVVIELNPLTRGDGFVFDSKVVGGNVPREYIPAVEKGVVKSMEEGPVAGFPVVDVGVTLVDGSSHSVDSSGMAFEIAGGFALRQGIPQAHPVLLEPVMHLRIFAPDDLTGDIISDLNTKRAQIQGMNPAANRHTIIEADAPLAMVQRYATDLRAITAGRASFEATFARYGEVPQQEMDKVVQQYKKEEVAVT
ncbi:MAG: elongation factor G [Chloroflexi bacterium]|jgi:elongation factor G|nr:elongation factor G [Chloroflexota bacterium]MBT4073218.1 elongation factor G [Chloroflexota bacterium]MBT4514419.1 elongation factor G [Chloroflexota bacterium]MBT5320623.1 elongation factor G [Chloroflexota bacterium]MBT6681157.1 elongation factor G [Chloroflexota bacterium]